MPRALSAVEECALLSSLGLPAKCRCQTDRQHLHPIEKQTVLLAENRLSQTHQLLSSTLHWQLHVRKKPTQRPNSDSSAPRHRFGCSAKPFSAHPSRTAGHSMGSPGPAATGSHRQPPGPRCSGRPSLQEMRTVPKRGPIPPRPEPGSSRPVPSRSQRRSSGSRAPQRSAPGEAPPGWPRGRFSYGPTPLPRSSRSRLATVPLKSPRAYLAGLGRVKTGRAWPRRTRPEPLLCPARRPARPRKRAHRPPHVIAAPRKDWSARAHAPMQRRPPPASLLPPPAGARALTARTRTTVGSARRCPCEGCGERGQRRGSALPSAHRSSRATRPTGMSWDWALRPLAGGHSQPGQAQEVTGAVSEALSPVPVAAGPSRKAPQPPLEPLAWGSSGVLNIPYGTGRYCTRTARGGRATQSLRSPSFGSGNDRWQCCAWGAERRLRNSSDSRPAGDAAAGTQRLYARTPWSWGASFIF